jgi:hypothetical protein
VPFATPAPARKFFLDFYCDINIHNTKWSSRYVTVRPKSDANADLKNVKRFRRKCP